MITLKINGYADRQKIVAALANSGYTVRVIKETSLLDTDYFVEILDDPGERSDTDATT